MKARIFSARRLIPLCVAAVLAVAASAGAVAPAPDRHEDRNFDERVDYNRGFEAEPGPSQLQALESFSARVSDLAATFDGATGATRTLSNRTGYLTGPQAGDAMTIARDFIAQHAGLLGLGAGDLDYEVTDDVFTRVTGARHIYLRQLHDGIPVYNGQLHVNVNRDGRVISVNNAFLPGLGAAVAGQRAGIAAEAAVLAAADHLGLAGTPEALTRPEGPRQTTRLRAKRHGQGGTKWHADETYVKVNGTWCYLYRAIDRAGNLVNVLLSEKRDMAAAQRFFAQALEIAGRAPEQVTTDGHDAYPRAIHETLELLTGAPV